MPVKLCLYVVVIKSAAAPSRTHESCGHWGLKCSALWEMAYPTRRRARLMNPCPLATPAADDADANDAYANDWCGPAKRGGDSSVSRGCPWAFYPKISVPRSSTWWPRIPRRAYRSVATSERSGSPFPDAASVAAHEWCSYSLATSYRCSCSPSSPRTRKQVSAWRNVGR